MSGGPAGSYGGFAPRPRQYGGGSHRLPQINDALNAGRGLAYDTTDWGSPVSIENRAFARAIEWMWSTNKRAANQFDPQRCTDMLPRWERIFQIFPLATDTPVERRVRLTFKWAADTKSPIYHQIVDDLTTKMGAVFVGLVHTASADGLALYPGSAATNPYDIYGTTTLGVSWVDWSSAVAHIAVQVTPTGFTAAVFNQAISEMHIYLDGALPSWCTFSWFTTTGFFLDQTNFGFARLDL
jgi:hypothetical protein